LQSLQGWTIDPFHFYKALGQKYRFSLQKNYFCSELPLKKVSGKRLMNPLGLFPSAFLLEGQHINL
jgi:hypothetical protein